MIKLKVIDIIGTDNAITHKFGLMVFKVIKDCIDKGYKVILSFEDLKGLTTAFLNCSIGNIYQTYPETEKVFEYTHVKSDWESKIKEAIHLARNAEERIYLEELIMSLFD
jgi:hypothetical protein